MEELKEPLIEMFTDDPVNWVKWAIVFTVLIGFFILAFKIYSKIEYHLSIQKKADQARAKGHVIPGAKRIKVRKKRTRSERNSKPATYSGRYRYVLDGKEKEYSAYFGTSYPPEEMDLYYKNSPRKLFSVEEYYWGGFQGVLYLILIFMPFVLAAFTAMALKIPNFVIESDKESAEVMDTGAWEDGTIISEPYHVTLTCPEAGHPDSESDWSTGYRDAESGLDLQVQFNFIDAIPPEEDYPQEDTVLWEYGVVYEIRELPDRICEGRPQELCRAYLELGSDKYLQIDIYGIGEEYTPVNAFLENADFQDAFHVEILKIE